MNWLATLSIRQRVWSVLVSSPWALSHRMTLTGQVRAVLELLVKRQALGREGSPVGRESGQVHLLSSACLQGPPRPLQALLEGWHFLEKYFTGRLEGFPHPSLDLKHKEPLGGLLLPKGEPRA